MTDLTGHRIVDLSAELISRVTRLDATVEPGKRDYYNMPWIVEESINENNENKIIDFLIKNVEGFKKFN